MRGVEYHGILRADGPIVIAERRENVGFSELVRVRDRSGQYRLGRIVDISEQAVAVQLFRRTRAFRSMTPGSSISKNR